MNVFGLAVGHTIILTSIFAGTCFATAPVGWREGSCEELKAQAKIEYQNYEDKIKGLTRDFELLKKSHHQFMNFFGEDGDYRLDEELDQAIPLLVNKLVDEPQLLRNVKVSNLARWRDEFPSFVTSCGQGECTDNSYVRSLNEFLSDDEGQGLCDRSSIGFGTQHDEPGFMLSCRPSAQDQHPVNFYFKFSSSIQSYSNQDIPLLATRDVSMSMQDTSFMVRTSGEKNFIEIWSDVSLTYDLISKQYVAKTYGMEPSVSFLGDDVSKVDVMKNLDIQLTFSPVDGGFYGYEPVDMSSMETYWMSVAPKKCNVQSGRWGKYDEMLSWVKE